MELSTFDILLLFILAIAISLVIGVNVLYIVDKRLSDIQINVPACPVPVCPKPVCHSPSDSEVNKSPVVAHNKKEQRAQNNSKQKSTGEKKKVEPFTSNTTVYNDVVPYTPSDDVTDVADDPTLTNKIVQKPLVITSNSTPTRREILMLRQGYVNGGDPDGSQKRNNDNTLISPPNSTTRDPGVVNRETPGDRITYPNDDDVVRYNGYGCYQNIDSQNVRKVDLKKVKGVAGTCRPYTDDTVTEGTINTINTTFLSPMTNEVKDIKSGNIRFHVPKVYMGRDPYISGVPYSMLTVGGPADVDQIGSIPVNDYDKEPIPISAFVDDS